MSQTAPQRCPKCRTWVATPLVTDAGPACPVCHRPLAGDRRPEAPLPEPLGLPRGSIRALVALAVSATCWWLIFRSASLPAALVSLVLAIIGYYFGLRSGRAVYAPASPQASSVGPASVAGKAREPLGLPAGAIRTVLVVGFLAAGLKAFAGDALADESHLEVFLVLGGMIVGHLFGRVLRRSAGRGVRVAVNHVGGLVVLAAAVALAILLLTRPDIPQLPRAINVLACVVSFYYGSRA